MSQSSELPVENGARNAAETVGNLDHVAALDERPTHAVQRNVHISHLASFARENLDYQSYITIFAIEPIWVYPSPASSAYNHLCST